MAKAVYDPSKVSFKRNEDGTFVIAYEGLGSDIVPPSLIAQLQTEARMGYPKSPDYYNSWEFMQRCIEHHEKQ